MRVLFITILVFSLSGVFSQEYFFEFIPGWRSHTILQDEAFYVTFGLGSQENISHHFYQFSTITPSGFVDTSWTFALDTAILTSTHGYTNGVLSIGSDNFVAGLAKGDIGGRIFGTLTRFDSKFQNVLSLSTYDYSLDTRMHCVIKNHRGNLLVAGEQALSFANYFPILYEMTLEGDTIWSKVYSCGSNCDLIPFHVLQTTDNGYFYSCKENINLDWPYYIEKTVIIKTDSLGNEEYRLHPGNPDLFTVAGWVLPTDDGNYITAYSDPDTITDNLPQANYNATIWIQKLSIIGETLFSISMADFLPRSDASGRGFKYYITEIIRTEDNCILITGYKNVLDNSGFLLKITQEGDPLWYRFISPPQAEGNDADYEYTRILGITPTNDGGYIMAGEYGSTPGNIFPEGIQTAIAVKVDEFGCLEPGCQLADDIPERIKNNLGMQVWPNPASTEIHISIDQEHQIQSIKLYDVTGKEHEYPSPPSPSSGNVSGYGSTHQLTLDISYLINGMYLIEVITKEGLQEVKRIVISN
jgi:hypothetical protein